jgi:hypothetical protein
LSVLCWKSQNIAFAHRIELLDILNLEPEFIAHPRLHIDDRCAFTFSELTPDGSFALAGTIILLSRHRDRIPGTAFSSPWFFREAYGDLLFWEDNVDNNRP